MTYIGLFHPNSGSVVVRCGPLWSVVVRCGPLWSVVVRCGPLWSVVVRCGPLWSVVVRCVISRTDSFLVCNAAFFFRL